MKSRIVNIPVVFLAQTHRKQVSFAIGMVNKMKKIDKPTVIIFSIILAIVIFCAGLIYYGNQYTENRYSLSEINDGVYAIYYTTHSRVPAQNYEVVTLNCNGNIRTYRGNVSISYTNAEPYVNVRISNMVNADKIYVYVPQGTVAYEESVNIGR